jgi:Arc/MetJ-type ribon-helix-helix transcriptional regulator
MSFVILPIGMIKCNTRQESAMSKEKIAITLDGKYIGELDRLVEQHIFKNRSQAIQEAVSEKLLRMKKTRLSKECSKMEPVDEREIAEAGFSEDIKKWPEY